MQIRIQGTVIALALVAMLLLAREAAAGPRSRPVRTGQTTCSNSFGTVIDCAETGQDGELRAGEGRSYVDNGDGTIRDKRTGLTWEKLSDDGSTHDWNNPYTWAAAFGKIAGLNTLPCFAGFCDWRLPNRSELDSIVNIGPSSPVVSAAFNTGCAPGCTPLTCSCTVPDFYWSSSTYAPNLQYAWFVFFADGSVYADGKQSTAYVRAVRGGS